MGGGGHVGPLGHRRGGAGYCLADRGGEGRRRGKLEEGGGI